MPASQPNIYNIIICIIYTYKMLCSKSLPVYGFVVGWERSRGTVVCLFTYITQPSSLAQGRRWATVLAASGADPLKMILPNDHRVHTHAGPVYLLVWTIHGIGTSVIITSKRELVGCGSGVCCVLFVWCRKETRKTYMHVCEFRFVPLSSFLFLRSWRSNEKQVRRCWCLSFLLLCVVFFFFLLQWQSG